MKNREKNFEVGQNTRSDILPHKKYFYFKVSFQSVKFHRNWKTRPASFIFWDCFIFNKSCFGIIKVMKTMPIITVLVGCFLVEVVAFETRLRLKVKPEERFPYVTNNMGQNSHHCIVFCLVPSWRILANFYILCYVLWNRECTQLCMYYPKSYRNNSAVVVTTYVDIRNKLKQIIYTNRTLQNFYH